ncbi:hypothetical protein O181_120464 [Austropuccinia psidii MF-1]|uniref:Uncharacterized protein n=1 Tax=Austropuccinia psidii MF-1 TaxID=1389203 RepID=A0A9Q3KJ64_9BASI|nr:hypothetical protein [Austropuccinia psidii MF-1]
MSNCAIIMLEGELALTHGHTQPPLHKHPYTHMLTHRHPPLHMPMQPHHTHTRHKWFHVPPANCQGHLTLGPHMSCLCVHDVSHPCTRTCCIVRWAPAMSPAYAEIIYGYTSFSLGVPITHTHPHPRYCGAGSTSVIHKMTMLWRQSPFMDDLVKSNPPPLHQDWCKDCFDVCVQTGGSCVIFTNLWTVAGKSGGGKSELKGQGNQYWGMSQD